MFFRKVCMFSWEEDMFSQDLYINVTDKGIKRKRDMLIQA